MLDPEEQSLLDVEPIAVGLVRSPRSHHKQKKQIARAIDVPDDERLTLSERLADRIAGIAGSWAFMTIFLGLAMIWIAINSLILLRNPWDPYPYVFLNLVLSMVAGMQAPIILMSQNRHGAKDRLKAQHDYEVNLKAEIQIEQLHSKLDHMRKTQWKELVELQQRQIALLEKQLEILTEQQTPR